MLNKQQFSLFLESMRHNDPVLVDDIKTGFNVWLESVEEPWFDNNGWLLKEIPQDCVDECTIPGRDAEEPCRRWVKELNFVIPRELAIKYLRECGAWDIEELKSTSAEDLAMKVLWIACGDINENGEWLGLIH